MEREDKYYSKAIGKALDTIGILRSSAEPLSLHDLSVRLALAKASVFRILHTLQLAGYVERDSSGAYGLAPDVRRLVPNYFLHDLLAAAMPRLKALSREFGETVSLATLVDSHIEVAAVIDSPQIIRMGNTVSRILPPHASSLGKAITSAQTEAVRDRLLHSYGLPSFTPRTIVDETDLQREYEKIRARGYSTDVEESAVEGCCFGAPIRTPGGEVPAALSVSVPKMRLDKKLQERIIIAIRRAAEEISAALQCPSPSFKRRSFSTVKPGRRASSSTSRSAARTRIASSATRSAT